MECKDAVVVVTGSSDRLGRQIALTLANLGSKVVVHCHTDIEGGKKTVSLIEETGGEASLVACDLTTMEGIALLIDKTLDRFGRWDALINCASLFETVGMDDVDQEQWQRDQSIHQRAPFFLSKALYRYAKGRPAGESCACVVNITDTGVRKPTSSRPSYYCAKTALEGQSVILGRTLAPYVRVNAVAPGAIIPASKADESYFLQLQERLPLGQLATVGDVVDAVIFLLKNDSITGQTIVVDGGEHLL
ncbi:SDR family oxidoreductase [Pleomorphochaeta sp. DL1XJH-081]|uniref:SDR family oxidoreductase n=1 Tax=Pleomorphochaeta sp. DL1XJH-081 TaxID=3409690 RepID=UPI003BB7B5AF